MLKISLISIYFAILEVSKIHPEPPLQQDVFSLEIMIQPLHQINLLIQAAEIPWGRFNTICIFWSYFHITHFLISSSFLGISLNDVSLLFDISDESLCSPFEIKIKIDFKVIQFPSILHFIIKIY